MVCSRSGFGARGGCRSRAGYLWWCEANIDAASPVRRAVDQAFAEFQRRAASERAAREQQAGIVEEKLRALQDQKERLLKGEHQPPPPPYTRDPEARRTSDGAPFWALCEFSDHVPAEQRAAVEAAMESSGLLDAWVNPEGTILSGEMRFDTFLLDDGQKAGFPGRPTLADVLRPSADRPGGLPAPSAVPTSAMTGSGSRSSGSRRTRLSSSSQRATARFHR